MVINANTKMTNKVLMVAAWRAIKAYSVKHRGEKRKFHFGMPRMSPVRVPIHGGQRGKRILGAIARNCRPRFG